MAPRTLPTPGTTLDPHLGAADLAVFARDGYLVLPGHLPADLVDRVRSEVDTWVDTGLRARSIAAVLDPAANGAPDVVEIELPAHGELVAHPPLLASIATLIGTSFAFHHLHSDRQAPGTPGKAWHHDYEQEPQRDRRHAMVHTLHYLDGLDTDTSSLVVLPGSHREVADKDARNTLGTRSLPGEVVLDRLPPGSTVVLHSALFHARRRNPGQVGRDRYFVDASYCATGTLWPPVKPYWRTVLRRARALGLDGGRWPELFDERHFSEYRPAGRRTP